VGYTAGDRGGSFRCQMHQLLRADSPWIRRAGAAERSRPSRYRPHSD